MEELPENYRRKRIAVPVVRDASGQHGADRERFELLASRRFLFMGVNTKMPPAPIRSAPPIR